MILKHIKRLSWPLAFFVVSALIAAFVGISPANLQVIVYKFLIFCPSVVLVHLSRKALFPYLDLQRHAHFDFNAPIGISPGQGLVVLGWYLMRAAVILGIFLYYVVLIYALTQAI